MGATLTGNSWQLMNKGATPIKEPRQSNRNEIRIDNPNRGFVSVCAKTTYACEIKTYDAGRSATEA
jgi:hypothetical protein